MRFQILSADVFTSNVGTPEQIETLRQEALAQRKISIDEFCFSNDKCWRSSFKYKDINWVIEEIRKLVNEAIDYYVQTDRLYGEKVNYYGIPTVKYWTNVNEPHSKNAIHSHSLHHFVAVYYLQSDDTGQLVFHNPANLVQECHPHSPFVSMSAFNPKAGDLYVWPGWVPHETETNFSDQQRINIAFNITFETPMMINHEKN